MDWLRRYWYESNAKKSRGGFIFMCISVVIFLGCLGFLLYNRL